MLDKVINFVKKAVTIVSLILALILGFLLHCLISASPLIIAATIILYLAGFIG